MNASSPMQASHSDSELQSPNSRIALSPKKSTIGNGIPLPDYHITRTDSELQLSEDMAMAEYRDRCMFNRLVLGIQQRRQQQQHYETQKHQFASQQGCDLRSRRTIPGGEGQRYFRGLNIPPLPLTSRGQDAEQTIEKLILTRNAQNDKAQHQRSSTDSSMITPVDSENEDGKPSRKHRRHDRSAASADDWAIEGFDDTPMTPRTQTRYVDIIPSPKVEMQSPNPYYSMHDHSDHLFDMEL